MHPFIYSMPTKIICGTGCVNEHKSLLAPLGQNALIVTGASSAKNGALSDFQNVLAALDISWAVYDRVPENPSLECVQEIADFGRLECCDFVVAIGGGSPMDAGKAAAVLLKCPDMDAPALYTEKTQRGAVPVVAVPTTCGTGSEVTAVFVLTNHQMKTKSSTPQKVFPVLAFLDAAYLAAAPRTLILSTAVDALAHLIESLLCTQANDFSRSICESGIRAFGRVKEALLADTFDEATLFCLLQIATQGGMAIAQTGTSLPHYLGYALTYHKQVPHGTATGILLYEYLALFENRDRIDELLSWLDFHSLDALGVYLAQLLSPKTAVSLGEIDAFTDFALKNPKKLQTHPEPLSREQLRRIYIDSCKRAKILTSE